MATRYISLGDTLVERSRIVGARYVPEDSPVATADSKNCIRLQLRRPDQIISINPLPGDELMQLYRDVQDRLNDVQPAAASDSASESDPVENDEAEAAAANDEPSAEAEPSPEAAVDDEAETEAAAEALPQ